VSGLVGRALAEAAVALGAEDEHGEVVWSAAGWTGYERQNPDAFVLTMVGAEVTLVTRMVGVDAACLGRASPGVTPQRVVESQARLENRNRPAELEGDVPRVERRADSKVAPVVRRSRFDDDAGWVTVWEQGS
jgi:hypothetical protein